MPEAQQSASFLDLEVGGKSVEEILAAALILNAMQDGIDKAPSCGLDHIQPEEEEQ